MDLLRSLPLGLYLEHPVTWLHRLDPRVKLAWLMTFLITPLLANLPWRIGIVAVLFGLTISARIPWRVWRQQMGWMLFFCLLVLGITTVMPDGLAVRYQPRLPMDELQFSQSPTPVPKQPEQRQGGLQLWQGWGGSGTSAPSIAPPHPASYGKPYRYTLFQAGPATITRYSLQLGVQLGTGYFTLIYSTTLFLLTTAPEEITAALDSIIRPLRRWPIPFTEISLTLTLSLRFIPLVLEEVQNLVRSVRTRAINWKKLGMRGAAQLWLTVADRLLENLFLRAEQIASAMTVRGFTSPNQHQVQWQQLQLRSRDWVALGLLGLVLSLRIWVGVLSL
ncbi:MAG: CbiQ family ECF transporter T component [Thermosynechococcaceae cyanobacterium]